jgi:hypothetical protein
MMADNILSFQDPENLPEKQFILLPDTEALRLYEITLIARGRTG